MLTPQSHANEELIINLSDGSELQGITYPADGEALLIAFPSDHGITPGLVNLAKSLNEREIEVWIPDPFTTWFLPEAESSLARIPVFAYRELIAEAAQTGKRLYLFGNDKGTVPLLEAARAWQAQDNGNLSGVILVSPDLYTRTPVAGEDGELLPIAHATNLPIYLFIPTKSTLSLRINETLDALGKGGSDVYIHSLRDVRNRFYFRPDATGLENQLAASFADRIAQAMQLTRSYAHQRKPAPLKKAASEDRSRNTGSLKRYTGEFQPPEFALVDLNGEHHSLARHRGKVVLVNFWASWCPPCVHEIPSMSRLYAQLADQPFTILAINLGEQPADIEDFLEQHPVNFPVLLDPDQRIPRQWKVFAFPTSYLLDRQGRIRYSIAGGIDWTSREVKTAMTLLLSE